MEIRYLLDENLAREWRTQLLYQLPQLMVWIVGDPSAPALGNLVLIAEAGDGNEFYNQIRYIPLT